MEKNNDKYYDQMLKLINYTPDIIIDWDLITNTFDRFRFKDEMSDQKRIDIYIHIISNWKKFITSKKDFLLENIDDPGKIEFHTTKWLSDLPQRPRDGWNPCNIVSTILCRGWIKNIQKYVIKTNKVLKGREHV